MCCHTPVIACTPEREHLDTLGDEKRCQWVTQMVTGCVHALLVWVCPSECVHPCVCCCGV